MSGFYSWFSTFQDAKQAARAAYDRVAQLDAENAQMRAAMDWQSPASPPPTGVVVLIEFADSTVLPGFRDAADWRYVDGMPIAAVEVTGWRAFPVARTRPA